MPYPFLGQIHTLSGTTFSCIKEKGSYPSEEKAIFTLKEIEKWLVLSIVGQYHLAIHRGLGATPLKRWEEGLKDNNMAPVRIVNEKAFLIDFLPIIYRMLQRQGFVVDHIVYYGQNLRRWIMERPFSKRFLIRRDPRDLSRIYVLSPEGTYYEEVPYRTLSNPSVTLWEHQKAVRLLRKQMATQVDETALFRTIQKLRRITEEAALKTKRARRYRERLSTSSFQILPSSAPSVGEESASIPIVVKPFKDIEEWDDG